METMDLTLPVKKISMHRYCEKKERKVLIESRCFFEYIYACIYLYVYTKDIKMGG